MKDDTPEHAKQRQDFLDLLDANGLGAHRAALEPLLKPAIALRTRAAAAGDGAIGATRVGGEPDLPDGFAWPEGAEGPLLFVLQVDLAQVHPYDLEELLPPSGVLSLFSDRYLDHTRAHYLPDRTALARRAWAPTDDAPFTACGVDVVPELQPPPHSSRFVAIDAPKERPGSAKRMGSLVALPPDAHTKYWDDVYLAWRNARRTGSAGRVGIHQMLGYAFGDDTGEQTSEDEVLFGFDSDDNAGMEWGDVQCVWAIMAREDLRARSWEKLRATT